MMTPDDGGGLGQRWIIYLGIEGNWLRDEHPGREARDTAGEPPALRLDGCGVPARLTC